jgi:hypothetical protein
MAPSSAHWIVTLNPLSQESGVSSQESAVRGQESKVSANWTMRLAGGDLRSASDLNGIFDSWLLFADP